MVVNNLLRKQLVRQVAREQDIPKEVVEDVIKHCFKGIREAFKTNRSIEMTGWGRFLFKERRATRLRNRHIKRIKEMQEKIDNNYSPRFEECMKLRIAMIQAMVDDLNRKLND